MGNGRKALRRRRLRRSIPTVAVAAAGLLLAVLVLAGQVPRPWPRPAQPPTSEPRFVPLASRNAEVEAGTTLVAPPSATLDPAPSPTAGPTDSATESASPSPSPGATTTPVESAEGEWDRRAELLEANSEMSVAELDGNLYVLGGYPSSRTTVRTVQVYDPSTDSWSLTTPLPAPVNHGMPAAYGGRVYLIGGQSTSAGSGSYLDTVFAYDPADATWSERARMPTARSAGAAAVAGGKIYVAGGRPPRGSDFAVYDPAADQWTTLPDLPTQRNHLAAEAIHGVVYVVGGRFGGGFASEVTDVVEAYDPAAGAWSTRASMPTARGGVNGVEADGCLHIFGGEGNTADPTGLFDQHEVYDLHTDSWRRLRPMPVAVHGVTGAAFLNGWIHLPGGGTAQGGSSGSTIHQVYRPAMRCG